MFAFDSNNVIDGENEREKNDNNDKTSACKREKSEEVENKIEKMNKKKNCWNKQHHNVPCSGSQQIVVQTLNKQQRKSSE